MNKDENEKKPFAFNDIALLDNRSIQKVLRELDFQELLKALKSPLDNVKQKIFCSMSRRAANILKDDLEYMGPVSLKDIEEAQQRIVSVVRHLDESGEIFIPYREPVILRTEEESAPTPAANIPPETVPETAAPIAGSGEQSAVSAESESDGVCLYSQERLTRIITNIEETIRWKAHYLSLDTSGLLPSEVRAAFDAFKDREDDLRLIRSLTIDGGFFEAISRLTSLNALEHLTIEGKVPEGVCEMTSLKSLSIHCTEETTLPEHIGNLPGLVELRLYGSSIEEFPGVLRGMASLEEINISYTGITRIPEWLAELPRLTKLEMYGLDDCEVPETLRQNKSLAILKPERLFPDHELNYDEFVSVYYKSIQIISRFSEKARRDGLLALEEELEQFAEGEFLKLGFRLVVDGTDAEIVRELLSILHEQEHDYYKSILKRVQLEGILSIQAGENPRLLLVRLNSMVHIPGNKISALISEGFVLGSDYCLKALADISHDMPPEREEIRFIKRAMFISEKARREGLLALEWELDKAAIEREDVFEYGLPFVIDRCDREILESILDHLVEREQDPWKKRLARAKRSALLSIYMGDNLRILVEKIKFYFDEYVHRLVKALF